MDNYNNQSQPFSRFTVLNSEEQSAAVPKKFMANVFAWMFVALSISALCAYAFATTPELLNMLYTQTPKGLSPSGLGLAVIFAPLAFVLIIGFGFARLSFPAIAILFIVFAAVMGISLSNILLLYTQGSVLTCFMTASAMFGVMAFLGYTTNQDLTSFGRIMMMGLFGIVIAMVINWFLHSAQLDYFVSIIGVAVFTGLTAYDVQKLKRIGAGLQYEGVSATDTKKVAITGAMSLYLDFVNLFLMLLRLFGRRK